jgi:DNA-binding CsgD family transcriptional regulator
MEIASDSSSHGNYLLRRPVTSTMAQIAYHQGRLEAVQHHVHLLLPAGPESAPGSAVLHDTLLLQRLSAAMALDAGELELARRWLEANDRWLAWSGSVLGRAENEIAWARLSVAASDPGTAWERVERAIGLTSEPDQPLARMDALRMRGVLAGGRGNVIAAGADLRAALDLADACAAPFERARTLVELARLDVDGSARDLLGEARAICIGLHADPLLTRIASLAVGAPGEEDAARSGDLTTRELEVLRLAAEGLTDAEIGERLFISPRTASQHLRSIYGKLGIRSRSAATRYAIEHELT